MKAWERGPIQNCLGGSYKCSKTVDYSAKCKLSTSYKKITQEFIDLLAASPLASRGSVFDVAERARK